MKKKICKICKKQFFIDNYRSHIAKFCSYNCLGISKRGKHISPSTEIKKGQRLSPKTEFKKGQKAHNYKGEIIGGHGYVKVHIPTHPFHDKLGYVKKHRLVMEKHLGRYLTKKEVVHHIDGVILNNHISNLMLFPTNSAHIKFHHLPK